MRSGVSLVYGKPKTKTWPRSVMGSLPRGPRSQRRSTQLILANSLAAMANATTADARAGYEVYRTSGFTASRAAINDALEQAGHNPVSDRMHRHYRQLAAAGFDRYISINRFDVSRASEPYSSLSAKSQYQYLETGAGVRVTFPRGRNLVEAFGRADRIGESGLIVTFTDSSTVEALSAKGTRPNVAEWVRVDMLDPSRQVEGRIIEVERTEDQVTLEVEFDRLQSIAEYVDREPLEMSSYEFRVIAGDFDEPTVDVIGRQLYSLFELIETARSIVNEAAHVAEGDYYASVAKVDRLSMQSPLVAVLFVPTPVAVVVGTAMPILGVAIGYERWRRARLENNSKEIDNQTKEAKAELQKELDGVATDIVRGLREHLKFSDSDTPIELTKVAQLAPVIRSLAEQNVEAVGLTEQDSGSGKDDS